MVTHVFYSPHTDDEAIGMAGAIIRAKAAGCRVVLVLVTDNLPSGRAIERFFMRANMSADQLVEARLREFRKSAEILGVDEVRYLGLAEKTIAHDRDFARASLLGAMSALEHEFIDKGDDVIHHTVMGAGDIHRELGRSTQAHRLCEDAAAIFSQRYPLTEVFAHAVYLYSFPAEDRDLIAKGLKCIELTPAEMTIKRWALDAYKAGDDRIGYGYDSVPDLIDAAATDNREYFWEL